MIEIIKNRYGWFLSIGLHPIAILFVVGITDVLKTKIFSNFKFYNKKTSAIINILTALFLSFVIALLTYILIGFSWKNIFFTTLTSLLLSIFSHNFIKGIMGLLGQKEKDNVD